MGQDFERNLSNALNDYFETHREDEVHKIPKGVAFRDTQQRNSGDRA